jgi:hypothetical protein
MHQPLPIPAFGDCLNGVEMYKTYRDIVTTLYSQLDRVELGELLVRKCAEVNPG